MAAQLSPKDIEDLIKRAQDQAKIIDEQKERMSLFAIVLWKKRDCRKRTLIRRLPSS